MCELVSEVFPDLRYVFLIRRNKVRQAISWWRAIQTGIWGWEQKQNQRPRQEPEYKFEAIDHLVQQIVLREAAMQEYFTDLQVRPLSMVYEDLVANPFTETRRVLKFLELPMPEGFSHKEGRQRRLADDLTEQWVERYRIEKQADGGAPDW